MRALVYSALEEIQKCATAQLPYNQKTKLF